MATIALYKSGFNQMPGLIKEVKDSVTDFKAELLALQTKAISIKKSVCNLENIIDSLQVSTQIQEEKYMAFESLEQNCEEFMSEAVRIDSEVADIVKQRKEEFYGAYSYLKPQSEKGWKEKAADWCKEHWKELLTTVVIVIGAALAIVAVICSGGLALVPMLTALLTTLGVSAGMATTIATVASLTIAGIAIVSTMGSSALNIVDTWCDMSENSTFKSWQTAMNWISIISNGLYSIGAIYNSVAAKLANVGKGGLDTLSTPSSKVLRQNLIDAGVEVPDYPNAAHHIVAGSSPKAAEARAILQKYGVDINDAANGTFLPTVKDVAEGAYHPSLHTNAYYDKINKLLSEATCKEDVLDILEFIGDELSSGTFMQ